MIGKNKKLIIADNPETLDIKKTINQINITLITIK